MNINVDIGALNELSDNISLQSDSYYAAAFSKLLNNAKELYEEAIAALDTKVEKLNKQENEVSELLKSVYEEREKLIDGRSEFDNADALNERYNLLTQKYYEALTMHNELTEKTNSLIALYDILSPCPAIIDRAELILEDSQKLSDDIYNNLTSTARKIRTLSEQLEAND